jgi:pyruvate ferredoxin oxidoreductase delta subunit
LKKDGWVILNTKKPLEEVKSKFSFDIRLAVVDASAISMQVLRIPIVSVSILGAIVRATGIVELKSLEKPVMKRFGTLLARKNNEALIPTFRNTVIGEEVFLVAERVSQRAIVGWRNLAIGCAIVEPGSSSQLLTGDWRLERPVIDKEVCNRCGLCWVYCPDMAMIKTAGGDYEPDLTYCKGCAICCEECPKNAIHMVDEEE